MSKKITIERWQEAQKAERVCHNNFLERAGEDEVRAHYKGTYDRYFHRLGLNYNQKKKSIIEIGCADYPALEHCEVFEGILIEPMPSKILKDLVKQRENLELISRPVEEITLPKCDEIWLLNVMQHVIDPDLFIEKCKEAAEVIRFFEPIDWPIEIYHPHTFDFEYFKGHFPEAKRYNGDEKGFHTAHCAYGIWEK